MKQHHCQHTDGAWHCPRLATHALRRPGSRRPRYLCAHHAEILRAKSPEAVTVRPLESENPA